MTFATCFCQLRLLLALYIKKHFLFDTAVQTRVHLPSLLDFGWHGASEGAMETCYVLFPFLESSACNNFPRGTTCPFRQSQHRLRCLPGGIGSLEKSDWSESWRPGARTNIILISSLPTVSRTDEGKRLYLLFSVCCCFAATIPTCGNMW